MYPQFATHNAHSIAAVLELAPRGASYEFQRLHGMGRLLYAEAARRVAGPSARARLRAGRRAQGSARLSGAPAARERRQYLLRESVHGRAGARGSTSCAIRSLSSSGSTLCAPASAGAASRSMRSGATRSAWTSAIRDALATLAPASPRAEPPYRGGPIINGDRARGATHAVDQSGRSRVIVGYYARCHRRGDRARRSMPPRGRSPRGRRRGGAVRAECLERAAALLEKSRRDFYEPPGARGRQDPARCGRRGARGDGLLPLLRGARARGVRAPASGSRDPRVSATSCRCTGAACLPASVPGISRWRFSPDR